MSSGANGLVLGQLTGIPGISASEAGSGHGSARRDQLTAAAMTGAATMTNRKAADNPQGDCFVVAPLLAMTAPPLSLRAKRSNLPAALRQALSTHSVFLKTA